MSGSMRDAMPQVAAWIDDLRAAFGQGHIDGAIRSGLRGRPHFWAREGEHELGTWWPSCEGEDDGLRRRADDGDGGSVRRDRAGVGRPGDRRAQEGGR